VVKQYPLIQSRAAKVAFGLFLTVILFLSRDTLISSCLIGFAKSQILMFGFILLLGVLFLWENRKHLIEILKDRRIVLMAASAAVLLVPMAVKQDWQLMYFSVLLCVLFAVFLTYFTTSREIAKYYVIILTVLGIYSIFATYVLRKLVWTGMFTVPVFSNSNEWPFLNFGLAYAVDWEFWNRNFGIFREPGVYQFFIILALYLNNYTVQWKKNWQTWTVNMILFVTMLTTLAIGGYIEMFLFIIFLYFDKKWHKTKLGKRIGLITVAIGIVVVALLHLWKRNSLLSIGVGTVFYMVLVQVVF